ncbi:Serine carboxypeptidase [Mycena sanguinolenta]|uniref:Serine carboxypeptidase n=1 Tax=Mycena sanguinolenta TaxID=230812 RepID=A0A8H7DGP5_9AGAR|nr:Serine carboxypeptidase [Mycena sanguinolenta]
MPEQITLYTAKICPFAHRVELALQEAKAGFTRFEIDLANKPEWYAPQVNPASKVPAIAYGGPQVSPDQPSPDSTKLTESLVLVELVADLFPESTILPKDPILRAKARLFIDAVSTKFVPSYIGPVVRGQSFEPFFAALLDLQALLPADKTFAASDEFTVADIAIAPFLARVEIWLKNDIGAYKEGEGKKAAEYLFEGDRFARLIRYFEAVKARDSFKATFHPEIVREQYAARFAPLRAQAQAAAVAAAS